MKNTFDVTWSQISTLRTCKRKYYYLYILWLVLKSPNIHFFVGTLIHLISNCTHLKMGFDDFISHIEEQAELLYEEYLNNFNMDAEHDKEFLKWKDLIPIIAEGYYDRYFDSVPGVLAIEEILRYHLFDDMYLTGPPDQIIEDYKSKRKGKALVHETKSAKSINANYIEKYVIDGQTMTYVILADANGYEINGIHLDLIRKPAIRQGMKESDASYYKRLMDLYTLYPDDYFYQSRYVLRTRVIKEHMRSIIADAREIYKLRDEHKNPGRYTIDARSCYIYGRCEYLPLCLNGLNSNVMQLYKKKETMNPELLEV